MALVRKFFFLAILTVTNFAHAESSTFDTLADEYFTAWKNSQQPNATSADLEQYLSYLTEDAAWQHLPYAPSDERKEGGKDKIRQGMVRWLGNHESYQATLIRAHKNKHFIILEFVSEATVKDEKTPEIKPLNRHYLDILELENNKVAVIRRYDIRD